MARNAVTSMPADWVRKRRSNSAQRSVNARRRLLSVNLGSPVHSETAFRISFLDRRKNVAARSFSEEHADETLNRVARKLSDGVEIRNISGYCYEVARLVFLETIKAVDSRTESLESAGSDLVAASDPSGEHIGKELRLTCLADSVVLPV